MNTTKKQLYKAAAQQRVDVSYRALQAAWAALQAAQVNHAVLVEELECFT